MPQSSEPGWSCEASYSMEVGVHFCPFLIRWELGVIRGCVCVCVYSQVGSSQGLDSLTSYQESLV